VIPVLVDGAAMPPESELPRSIHRLARLNAVEVSAPRFAFDVARLVEAIEGGPSCPACGRQLPGEFPFCPFCAAPLTADAEQVREVRKTVTAVFSDVVGSTQLGERLDPEVLRRVMTQYFEAMRDAVERHGGRVDKFIGDAVVAVFGVPQVHEDDALRAVRAATEMHSRLTALNETLLAGWGVELESRIGVSTGEVVVGADEALLGDVMNTAARLQSAAPPGAVLIGESTWRLVRDAVDVEALGALELKGKTEPVPAWRVMSVRAETARRATPFLGRGRYMRMLDDALEDAIAARSGALVTILAPPGVGKSRLAEAFTAQVRERAMVLVGQTPSYGDGVTFAPLVELLSQAAGSPSGDAETIAAALRERMTDQADGASVGDRLAQFLGVGESIGADTSWAVRRLLEVLAYERPLVVMLEDMHWAEPPMLDLIDGVVERVHAPVLFVCLARPELLERCPAWAAAKLHAVTTTLPPLSLEDARRISELLVGRGAPTTVVDQVCETAEGNPLYLEQLTAMLADQGLIEDGRWVGPGDASIEIPASLQTLLAARLDRLDPTPRLVMERASIEGRRFRIAAAQALAAEVAPDDVDAAIAALDRSGLVQPEDEARGQWRFAHPLMHDAAYRGLSKGDRAGLHEQFADWLAVNDADRPDVNESVARHLERALRLREELGARDDRSAALALRAGELFAAAGLRAFAAVDLIASRDLLSRAAMLLPTADPRRLDMLPSLGVTLSETGRPEETEALLSEAVEQSRAAGLERDALRATIQLLSNRTYCSPTTAEIDASVLEAERALNALDAMADDEGVAEAAIALEYLEIMRGRVANQHEWTIRALRHGLAAGRLRESAQAASDVVGSAVMGPLPFDQFAATANERLFIFAEPISSSAGHALLAIGALAAGDNAEFIEHEQRWREVIDRHGLGWLGAAHALEIANVETSVGKAEEAERRLNGARDVLAALGDIWWVSTLDSSLCAAVAAQDDQQRFLRLADAFDVTPPVADPQVRIRRQLFRARAFLLRGSAVEAETAARRGLELALPTDLVSDHADALLTLAEALRARGLTEEEESARTNGIALLRAKGNLAAIATLTRATAI
jgi:class 3 adenylate cyclase